MEHDPVKRWFEHIELTRQIERRYKFHINFILH